MEFIECDQLAKGKTIKFSNYVIVGTKEKDTSEIENLTKKQKDMEQVLIG